jgi:hypothetical protein
MEPRDPKPTRTGPLEPPASAPEPELVAGVKPGRRTTELWLTLATDVALLAGALAEALPPRWAAIAAAISNGLYALSRGWAKSGAGLV